MKNREHDAVETALLHIIDLESEGAISGESSRLAKAVLPAFYDWMEHNPPKDNDDTIELANSLAFVCTSLLGSFVKTYVKEEREYLFGQFLWSEVARRFDIAYGRAERLQK